MTDFYRRWGQMQKRGDRIRRTAGVIMILTWVLMGATALGGVYLTTHPELIGKFAGRVVAGFKGVND